MLIFSSNNNTQNQKFVQFYIYVRDKKKPVTYKQLAILAYTERYFIAFNFVFNSFTSAESFTGAVKIALPVIAFP